MSVLLCSLRAHFIKHLPCTSFFSTRNVHHLTPRFTHPSTHSSSSSQLFKPANFRKLASITATFSTSSSSSTDTPATNSPNSPYLSVRIRCQFAKRSKGTDIVKLREGLSHVMFLIVFGQDMLSEALMCFGASSTSIDEEDRSSENDEANPLMYSRNPIHICISSIFSIDQNVHRSISHAVDSIGLTEAPTYDVIMGYQSDWIKETQESFHPVEVTERIWIVPEWRTPPDLQATNIILNPGLAFGTGDHPTTKLCLLLLHNLVKGGEFFLDYGTGSGILAIAALKFGAALSVGLDVDPQAITASRQNAALNNIGPEKLQLLLVPSKNGPPVIDKKAMNDVERQNSSGMGIISETEKYDVVIANILLNPLLDLADHIVSYAKPGAVVGLSGIISEQLPHIMERYSQLLEGMTVSEMEDWACISGIKKKKRGSHL
ncbi:hypothetical protein RJ639_033364 [Escallonia herrerae]|uniref:ETFB lysine methyltransferase n=1 Tax=Escallonia herrerae TaxID=1293975 RepID=A0AA88WVM0_9ASTE|nr:hypothetical protein RJ639_033364 [Escallonia herrerae]